jgi:hypothetical protein
MRSLFRFPLAPFRVLARRAAVLALASASVFFAHDADAVGTRTFTLDTLEKLSGGDLKGVAVASDGTVHAGLTLSSTPVTDATSVFSLLVLKDGSVLIGTSPNGKVFKVQGENVSLFADTGALAVTALVEAANGSIYAATMPDGKIYKILQGKADVFATLQDTSHIWALIPDKTKTGFYAGTNDGKIMRIEPSGQSSVYMKTDEPHIVSLAMSDNGELYAGSSGKGLLYKLTGVGRATVLYDFPGEEVKAIAVGKNGVVWAIGNEYGEAPEAPKRSPVAGRVQSGGSSGGAKAKPGKGQLVRFDTQGRPEKMLSASEFHYMSLTLDEKGNPYVGTGAEGRVYTVDENHVTQLVADTDERQIGALAMNGPTHVLVASDPLVVHRVTAHGGPDAVWTSKVLDCGLRAHFGTLSWRSTGPLELSTRAGNSATPDATWSAWSPALATPGKVTSAPGRYVQVRARFSRDPNAVLTEVQLPFVTDNLRPVVTEVSAAQKGVLARDSKEALASSGGEPPKHDATVKLSWHVENPDQDQLRYRVAFKKEGSNVWRDVLKPEESLTKAEYEWDTVALPEGKYRVKVEASDELANPPADVQKHDLTSETFTVDHTPPTLTLALAGRKLKAHAVDGVSPIARVEIAVDGKSEWRPLGPADGMFDSPDESVDADVSSIVPPGSHLVTVRAFDLAGNQISRETDAN